LIRSEGFALILVLWVLSLLTIMAGSFALSMRRETAIVTGISNNAKAMATAESGLAIAELMLMNPVQLQRWRADGNIYQIDYPDSIIRVQLLAEAGKIYLNFADQALLKRLLANAPIDPELQSRLVDAILDWRDADDLVRLEGAEREEYKKAGLSYQPRNQPFQSIEELQLVLGMNEQVFKWLENLVTIYSGLAKVDLTQASKEVLQVLPGIDSGLIDEYCATRLASTINGLPAPTFPVVSMQDMTSGQNNLSQNAPQPTTNFQADPNNRAQQIGIITIVSQALLDDGSSAAVKALIKKSDTVDRKSVV
jgi:general secretion pathway protein K